MFRIKKLSIFGNLSIVIDFKSIFHVSFWEIRTISVGVFRFLPGTRKIWLWQYLWPFRCQFMHEFTTRITRLEQKSSNTATDYLLLATFTRHVRWVGALNSSRCLRALPRKCHIRTCLRCRSVTSYSIYRYPNAIHSEELPSGGQSRGPRFWAQNTKPVAGWPRPICPDDCVKL